MMFIKMFLKLLLRRLDDEHVVDYLMNLTENTSVVCYYETLLDLHVKSLCMRDKVNRILLKLSHGSKIPFCLYFVGVLPLHTQTLLSTRM